MEIRPLDLFMIKPLFFASSDLQLPDELHEPLISDFAHIWEGYGARDWGRPGGCRSDKTGQIGCRQFACR